MSAKVYRTVKKMIAVHRFEAGQHLNVEKIARELGVSRTPVWEAIRRLQQEGIVRTVPNRGVFTADLSLDRALEVIDVRGALDKLAGRLASNRISDHILNRLAQCLPDQLRAIETADVTLYSSADFRFHGLIYKASGNAYLKELFESTILHTIPARVQILPILPLLYLGHQEIMQGLAARDPNRVEEALARHVEIVKTHVKEQMRSANERKEMVRRMRGKAPYIGRLKNRNKVTEANRDQRQNRQAINKMNKPQLEGPVGGSLN